MTKNLRHKMKIFIVLPAYNEWTKILSVINQIEKEWFKNIVVVNDWSTDDTEDILSRSWVYYLSHAVNRWAWAATQTWINFSLKKWADIVVTMDSDGQHDPSEIKKLTSLIEKDWYETVIWSRFLETQKVPFIRRIFNKIWNFVTWFFFWAYVTDSQSWFKAFHKDALDKFEIESNWFEFCSEIIQKIHANEINYFETPISVKYTEYSQSKWQSFLNWVKTFLKLALHSLIK